MVSWAVTGATRGIGLGYIDKLSADPKNQVFALIRSRATADPLEALAAKRKNIQIIETDIASPNRLAEAAAEVAKATSGSLDVLILNAGSAGPETAALSPSAFHGKDEALDNEIWVGIKNNLISNMYVINNFLDLVRNGKEKKIVFISSNSGDLEFTRITGMGTLIGYSVAKAGMNMVMTKYGIELEQEGIKTLSLSPGWVNTDAAKAVTGDPEVRKWILGAFHKLDPSVTGPLEIDDSVTKQLKVIGSLTEEKSGKFLTHHGDKDTWF